MEPGFALDLPEVIDWNRLYRLDVLDYQRTLTEQEEQERTAILGRMAVGYAEGVDSEA